MSGHSEPDSLATSLLLRVRAHDVQAWNRLTYLYEPVVRSWCRKLGLRDTDADDVAQEVFGAVFKGIGRFRRDEAGQSFRGWLYTVTRSKVQDFRRRAARGPQALGGTEFHERIAQEPDAATYDKAPAAAEEEKSALYHRALDLIRTDFTENTWRAFWATAVEDRAAADIAAELGMSARAVYVAKSRVLNRLREEFAGLEKFED